MVPNTAPAPLVSAGWRVAGDGNGGFCPEFGIGGCIGCGCGCDCGCGCGCICDDGENVCGNGPGPAD